MAQIHRARPRRRVPRRSDRARPVRRVEVDWLRTLVAALCFVIDCITLGSMLLA